MTIVLRVSTRKGRLDWSVVENMFQVITLGPYSALRHDG